jgi:NADH-quinone oxidoreductase subunit L
MLPYSPIIVWLMPLVAAFLMPLAALHKKVRDVFPVVVGFASAVFAVSMIPDVLRGAPYSHPEISWIRIPGILEAKVGALADPLSVFMVTVVSCIGALILLYSMGYMANEKGKTRYWFFMLLFIGSMSGLVITDNFLTLYIFWEMVGLCSYALIGFWYDRPEARKAGMKAFLVTRVGDVFLLAGIIFIYLNVGSFSYSAVESSLSILKPLPAILATVPLLLLIGAIGKSAQLPLHVWLPDAMEGPTPVSALIHAATMVNAGVYLMARTHLIYSALSPEVWLNALIWVGAITALLTATMALASVDIKRVLAYSTISQIGLMMLALGLGAGSGFVFVSQFHLMSHAIFKALLFLCVGVLVHSMGTRDMRQMGGLRKVAPITFIACVIGMLALSGIPPLNGFWSKEFIFDAAMKTGNYLVPILFVLTLAVTMAYSWRLIILTFLGEKSDYAKNVHVHEPKVMIIPIIILSAFTFVTGFWGPNFAKFMGVPLEFHVESLTFMLSIVAFLAGGVALYFVYVRRSPSPEYFGRGFAGSVQKVLSNGYYFDRVYNAIFVNGLTAGVQKFRKTHPGILNYNILLIIGGLSVLVILFLLVGGL